MNPAIGKRVYVLAYQARVLRIENAPLRRAKLINDKNRYIIALVIKEHVSEIIERQMVIEAISSLLNVITN